LGAVRCLGKGCGDESMVQDVEADLLGDPGAAGDTPDDAGGGVPIRPPAIDSREQRSFSALADGQVDRPGGARGERDSDDFAALRVISRVRCPRSRPRCSMSAPVALDHAAR
jgi:hypothetical protein